MLSTRVKSSKTADLPAKAARGVKSGMMDAADIGFAVSQDEAPKDRATLMQSGIPPTWEGNTLVWGYASEHAEPVEEGTIPHYPPIRPLLGWARRVLDDEGAAWAIQETIGQEGTEPQPYVEPGYDEMVRTLRKNGLTPYIDDQL